MADSSFWMMDGPFWVAALACVFLVVVTSILFYEILRYGWGIFPRLGHKPRRHLSRVMLGVFLAHMTAVWIYAAAYWLLDRWPEMGRIVVIGTDPATHQHQFLDYVYFSAATYSSLGFGDMYPEGALRLIVGVEVISGLLLIGWSVAFSFVAMQKFWEQHGDT